MPPSPKRRACISSAMLRAIVAPYGPRTMAISTAPTMWAEVPSGIGRLNIMRMKAKAAMKESIGTFLGPRFRFPFLNAKNQMTTITRNMKIHVAGPRYPSGICMRCPLVPERPRTPVLSGGRVLSFRLCPSKSGASSSTDFLLLLFANCGFVYMIYRNTYSVIL